eukprot:GHVN01028861.1.p1 GENE.GHVN01028861.1~~GHVN01028861.1.p1  ORF type:complete len:320 (-),score=43.92 GHVN01028861.1:148-1023(-)
MIEPLSRLEAFDQRLTHALASQGLAYIVVDPLSAVQVSEKPHTIVNLFDRSLPAGLLNPNSSVATQLVVLLRERRELECFLQLPNYKGGFDQRYYVLKRIAIWARMGLEKGFVWDYRETAKQPRDVHIMQAVLFRWLSKRIPGFPNVFVNSPKWSHTASTGGGVPSVGLSVWLRPAVAIGLHGRSSITPHSPHSHTQSISEIVAHNQTSGMNYDEDDECDNFDVETKKRLFFIQRGQFNVFEAVVIFLVNWLKNELTNDPYLRHITLICTPSSSQSHSYSRSTHDSANSRS